MNNLQKTAASFAALMLLTACGTVENANQNVLQVETSTGTTLNENSMDLVNANTNSNVNLNLNTNIAVPVQSEYVRNLSLVQNQTVESPLVISGEVKGWYFEGSFPIEIQDANGKVLAIVPAQAKGEWMTENFVPFSASLNFSAPTTATGNVVLRKDNPSGLPENDMSYTVPVKFVGAQ
ncbi:MAG: Gmad2 immunoglobulin-like domain-containing protein [Candidatus Gracilibacteria bacterium]